MVWAIDTCVGINKIGENKKDQFKHIKKDWICHGVSVSEQTFVSSQDQPDDQPEYQNQNT